MRNLVIFMLALAGVYIYLQRNPEVAAKVPLIGDQGRYEDQLRVAVENQASNLQVRGAGKIIELLPADSGRIHQLFRIETEGGHILLLDHNTELAPALKSPQLGDKVYFFGEFDWTERGGVVHHTYNDSSGEHMSGWVKHMGRTYQ
ncbi:MAG: DUF3465 domain-containing protein [Pseudomonadota bacterium]